VTAPLERTSRRIAAGTWGCAVIIMVASAAGAALTYGALGDNRHWVWPPASPWTSCCA
jgi:hypothetical protein